LEPKIRTTFLELRLKGTVKRGVINRVLPSGKIRTKKREKVKEWQIHSLCGRAGWWEAKRRRQTPAKRKKEYIVVGEGGGTPLKGESSLIGLKKFQGCKNPNHALGGKVQKEKISDKTALGVLLLSKRPA